MIVSTGARVPGMPLILFYVENILFFRLRSLSVSTILSNYCAGQVAHFNLFCYLSKLAAKH